MSREPPKKSAIYTDEFDADWATAGVRLIDEALSSAGIPREQYSNGVFEWRAYVWDDDEPEALLPNFRYKPRDIRITWYKHVGRSMSSASEEPDDWPWLVVECINSIPRSAENR